MGEGRGESECWWKEEGDRVMVVEDDGERVKGGRGSRKGGGGRGGRGREEKWW